MTEGYTEIKIKSKTNEQKTSPKPSLTGTPCEGQTKGQD